MTDEQREFVDDVRTVLHDEDAAIHVDLVSLVRIIDAQEADSLPLQYLSSVVVVPITSNLTRSVAPCN